MLYAPTLYEVRIALKGAKPPVWRRVRVDPDRSLGFLHVVVQAAMGWKNEHLHVFERKRKGGLRELFSPASDADFGGWPEEVDEEQVTLRQVCPRVKDTLDYEYDFGDSWRHRLTISKEVAAEPGMRTPECLSGKGACPPEDCGGLWGYAELLEAVNDPEHPEHEEMSGWYGEEQADPTAFSLAEVNRRLAHLHGAGDSNAPASRVERGLEWEGFLAAVDVAELLAAGPPEARALLAESPAGSLPTLWCVGFREEGAQGFAGVAVSLHLPRVEAASEEAVLELCERFDAPPSLPERLRVSDRRMIGWFPTLTAAGVSVELATELATAPGIDEQMREAVLAELNAQQQADGPLEIPPMSSGHGVRDNDVRAFQEAASAFAHARPWQWFPPQAFLEVRTPEPPQGMKLFSVHRGPQGSFAVHFLKNLAQAKAVSSKQSDAELLGHLEDGMWSIDLEPLNVAPPEDVEEAARLGVAPIQLDGALLLAGLVQLRFDGARRATGKRLRFATALLHAIALQSAGVKPGRGKNEIPLEISGVPGVDDGRFLFEPREID